MKKINPLKLAIAVLGFSTVASLVGSISGTIAWYAYSTRALISYAGTSVQSTTQLQIGIKSSSVIDFSENENANLIEHVTFPSDLYYDETNDPGCTKELYHYHYYFMKVGSGGMPASVINDYLRQKGYATDVLEPLSSYSYTRGGLLYVYSDSYWNVAEINFEGELDPNSHDFGDSSVNEGNIYYSNALCKYYYYSSGIWSPITRVGLGNPNKNSVSETDGIYYIDSSAGEFNLRNRPITNNPSAEKTTAEKTKYVEIPFAFRVLSKGASNPGYVGNHDIFLSNAKASLPDESNFISNSIRLYIERTNGTSYILNPSSISNGKNKCAGVLNLTGGGTGKQYYDFDNDPASSTYLQEYLYGDYEWKKDMNWVNSLSAPLAEDTGLVDINGTNNTSTETTFTSRHRKGVKYFENLDNCISPHYAHYLGTDALKLQQNSQGKYESNYAVCKTGGADQNFIGSFNMKVYLEGWDHSVIDSQLRKQFYLGLTFQINIVENNNQ